VITPVYDTYLETLPHSAFPEAMSRRVLAEVVGTLAVLVGVVAFEYASMALEDFRNPNVSFWTATLGIGIMWLLTLRAFGMGIHFLKHCFTGEFFQLNPWVRAFILGALSFFPDFILSAPPAITLAQERWPGDSRADNVAILVSVCFGAVLAFIVCGALVRRARRTDAALAPFK
jgi:hypothetical protein